jgi:hypothetical protein
VDARLVGAAIAGSFWCDGYGDLVPLRVSLAVISDITTAHIQDKPA